MLLSHSTGCQDTVLIRSLLHPQVSDSGTPPLSSSTSVKVHIREQSHYPPSALPLEIFITIGEEEFQGVARPRGFKPGVSG